MWNERKLIKSWKIIIIVKKKCNVWIGPKRG